MGWISPKVPHFGGNGWSFTAFHEKEVIPPHFQPRGVEIVLWRSRGANTSEANTFPMVLKDWGHFRLPTVGTLKPIVSLRF